MTAQDQTQEDEDTPNVAQMREQWDKKDERIAELETQLKTQAFTAAGLDPSTGMGELLANAYDGEYTKEAVAEFAKSKGVELTTETPTKKTSPEQTLVAKGQERLDQVHDQSQPLSEPSIDDDIAKAAADGNWKLHISLQNAKQLAREQSGDYVIGQ